MNTDLAWQVIAVAAVVGAVALWATFWWLLPARRGSVAFGVGHWLHWCWYFCYSSTGTQYAEVVHLRLWLCSLRRCSKHLVNLKRSMRRLMVGGAIITAMALVAAIVGRLMRGR
ncbi:MAG: hypothetical protein CM15mP120_17500 [Pseudomonadota bacterium]|nr:MAG: hypothetical protein CM15mP120_17500 [Pseudomonadota bacterium]